MIDIPFLSRQERFPSVGSTNDVVRAWLEAGTPEVCLAVADEQLAGRGRLGRSWVAPAGAGLLLSLGFRPGWLDPTRTWRLPAIVALAMADAAEEVAGLRDRAIRLKWPNDLVVEDQRSLALPLAQPIGGTSGPDAASGGALPRAQPIGGKSGPDAASGGALPRAQPIGDTSGPDSVALPRAQPIGDTSGPERLTGAPFAGFAAGAATDEVHSRSRERPEGDLLNPRQRPPEYGRGSAVPATAPAPAGARKLAGILSEAIGLGTADPRVIIGIGVNADWSSADFPADLAATMTSLRVASGGRPVDRDALLDAFTDRLEARTVALRAGRFDVADWVARQLTVGRSVRLELPDGGSSVVWALGVDAASGGLIVADPDAPGGERTILTGEIVHLHLAGEAATPRVEV